MIESQSLHPSLNASAPHEAAASPRPRRPVDLTPYAFLAPALLILGGVLVLPILFSFVMSFFRFNLIYADAGLKFEGLGNYRYIAQDQSMLASLRWTAGFTVVAVALELVLGMGLALLLNASALGRARGFLRGLFLIPIVIPGVLAAWMWRLMFDSAYGPVNHLLSLIGAGPVPWGADALTARVMIIAADVWLSTPFVMLILLAGLQNIPAELLEAASIDGASPGRQFASIVLPLLKFPVMVVLVIRTMDALRLFDQIFVLTNGGPGSATTTLMYYNYRYAFSYFQLGRASALSFSFMIVIFVITYLYTRLLRREASA